MSVTSYLYIYNVTTGKPIEGNPAEGPESLTMTEDGKLTNTMMKIVSSDLSVRNNWDMEGNHADAPSTNDFNLSVVWDNSMTVLFDSLIYGDALDCKVYFFGKGLAKEGTDSAPHNWFTVEMLDSRLSMTDLFKPKDAGSMEEEVISLSLSYKAIRITDHDMANATASYNWGDKTGAAPFPPFRG